MLTLLHTAGNHASHIDTQYPDMQLSAEWKSVCLYKKSAYAEKQILNIPTKLVLLS